MRYGPDLPRGHIRWAPGQLWPAGVHVVRKSAATAVVSLPKVSGPGRPGGGCPEVKPPKSGKKQRCGGRLRGINSISKARELPRNMRVYFFSGIFKK